VHGQVKLAAALTTGTRARDALAAGDLVVEQARVIVEAVDKLPKHLGRDVAREAHLVGEAAHHDARALRILGRRLLEVVAPEEADAYEAERLADEEAAALAATGSAATTTATAGSTAPSPSRPSTALP
jgi:hypothetical protein